MTMREQIVLVADHYATLMGIGRKRVSTIVLSRGSKLDDIAQGGDLTTQIYERAMLFFSRNWPADAEWPEGVDRPVDVSEAAE
jgi:hypothetical protein